jgi:AcrR family transcriptional regulator
MAKKTTVPRKRRPGRIARQADLLTTVYKVVSEVGIDAASMRQIADRAKVSTGTISYHFESKEKLVMAALQAAYQMPVSDDDANSSPLARLKAFAFRCILHEPNDRFWRFWMKYTVYGFSQRRIASSSRPLVSEEELVLGTTCSRGRAVR